MFIVYENENRVKRRIRYSAYMLKHIYLRELSLSLKEKLNDGIFKRISFEGFSVGFPLGVTANFRLVKEKEYLDKTNLVIEPQPKVNDSCSENHFIVCAKYSAH